MSKRIYNSGNDYAAGFPSNDQIGWYREVSDEEFEKLKNDGAIFEKDGEFYYKSSVSEAFSADSSAKKGFWSDPFKNPGATIKKIAKVLFYFGLVITFIYGIVAGVRTGQLAYSYVSGYSRSFSFGAALAVWIAGAITSYLSCLGLAALGDIAVNLKEINGKLK